VPYRLERMGSLEELSFPASLVLPPHRTVLAPVKSTSKGRDEVRTLRLPYRIKNLTVGPDRFLESDLELEIEFKPE